MSIEGWLGWKWCKLISKPHPGHIPVNSQICYKITRNFSNPCICTLGTQWIQTNHTGFSKYSCCCCCCIASVVSDSVWPHRWQPTWHPVPGILQARTLELVAISFSNAWKWKVKVKSFSRVRLLATPWTAAYQAPPSMGFSRQKYWSGVPLP